jgi:dolichol kinase
MTTTPRRRKTLWGLATLASWSIMTSSAFLGYFTGNDWYLLPFFACFTSTLCTYYLFLTSW